ncbi:MAG: preprotein translocase subunit SecG [candidate division Zixibacteria bacterium RBG_16_40_9]|nr:MAG: preprotein translocase subunit SecG [candidate division Zixibacteria bacterium RBG_16_40_9]
MVTFLVILHILISIALIIVVLLQSAKGEGLAGAFGGGSGITGAVFGGRGAATFLSKATSILAIAFFVSCIGLTLLSQTGTATRSSTVQEEARKQSTTTFPSNQPPPTQTQGQQGQTGTGELVLPPVPKDTSKW